MLRNGLKNINALVYVEKMRVKDLSSLHITIRFGLDFVNIEKTLLRLERV